MSLKDERDYENSEPGVNPASFGMKAASMGAVSLSLSEAVYVNHDARNDWPAWRIRP